MSVNFPVSLDSYATLVDNSDDVLAAHANDRGDAIEQLEIKLGVDTSAVATTIDYFLKHASGAYRTHVHDGSSDDGAVIPAANLPVSARSFVAGDWITSSVTTARTGWTNVSATYANKFMRIGATPLSTGGADSHSITLITDNLPSHTHSVTTYTGSGAFSNVLGGGGTVISAYAPTYTGSNVAFTSDNVPVYVAVVIFQMS